MWQFLSRKKLNLNKEFFGLGQQKHVRMEEENVSGEIKKKMFQEERGLEITGKLKTRKHALSKKLKIKSNIVP